MERSPSPLTALPSPCRAILLSAIALLAPTAMAAASEVLPLPKEGACPPGYYSSGNYCTPSKRAKPAIPKHGACPPGFHSTGNYCLGSQDSRPAVDKHGPCPPGYYTSGQYCVKSR